jgi:pulcherriminic acid synthase
MNTPKNSIDIFSPSFNQNPYPLYKEMRDKYPLYFYEPADAYVISRYEDVAFALKSPIFTVKNYEFQSEPLHGRTFIQMDGQEHSQYRNIIAPSIRGRDLAQNIIPIIEKTAKNLYSNFLTKTNADFATEFAARFPILVIVGILGLDKKDESNFLHWYRTFVDFIADLGRTPSITQTAFQTKEEITNYLLPIIQQKRQNPSNDLLSIMCSSEIDGVKMSDAEIKAFISLLITAGGESTDKMLSLMLRNLLQNPSQLEQVRNDYSLINKAFAESLRYSPVTHRLMRITSEEVNVSGGTIPKDSKVLLMLGAAQHDERQFKNPEIFDIQRDDLDAEKAFTGAANHLAFGAGRHFCVGAMLAKAEIEVAFQQLFDFADKISFDSSQFPSEFGLFTRGISNLPKNIL